jgi:hypothetical protein
MVLGSMEEGVYLRWEKIIKDWFSLSITYVPLTIDTLRGSRGVLDIPPRRPRFTKMT